jgi:hypothetical protein
MMRNLIYVFLGIFSINTLQISAQVRIGSLEDPHSSAVLDLNEADTMNNGNRGLALPRIKLSSDTDLLNGTTPPNGMMVYNTSVFLDQGVYYYSDGKWIKVSNGSFFAGDSIVGNEVVGPTSGGALKRDGSGSAIDPYTLDIDTAGVKNEMIAGEAVTGDKIANAPADKRVLQYDGAKWTPAQLQVAATVGAQIESIQYEYIAYSSGTWMERFAESDTTKTIYLVTGHYFNPHPNNAKQGYAPLYISSRGQNYITFPKTEGKAAGSVMIIKFK